ncbi:hypothetical protein [Micromonospora sp. NBC_01796]|uniref:hypothetical protein n=1 Tax=Micromonospora sp. NBC_01796 TaxID=2975987 RepID=UPI002DD82988|nr:hypothetical protein [Micromonospora sp. NBC_01796]WSA87902.1 hypothetical protein OIE47_10010 [Micromonospora sp. NBC_01796]
MTSAQRVSEMASYLASTGWQRRPETWRGASIWDGPGGNEVLVPARDGLDDAAERTWELLQVLAMVENRPIEEIANDIASPMSDMPFVRTFPEGLPSGYIGLSAGVRVLQGVRTILEVAGRTEIEGVRATFSGSRPSDVGRLIEQIQLGPSRSGSYLLTLRVDVGEVAQSLIGSESGPLARRTLVRLFRATTAVRAATMDVQAGGDFSVFDDAIDEGVSANLCRGLSDLAGLRRRQPFEVGFRWARGLPSYLGSASIAFPEGAGITIFEAAKQLERLAVGDQAQILGVIESLHDEATGSDRWRVRVRGELTTEGGEIDPRRPVWVRLTSSEYRRAMEAHREHRTVRARGRLELAQRRVELFPHEAGFEIFS